MPPNAILLVSDDLSLKVRLASWLEGQPDFLLRGVAHTLSQACVEASHYTADVLLIDLTLPDAADELLWSAVRFCYPGALLIVLFDGQYGKALRLAVTAGARSVLPRDDGKVCYVESSHTLLANFRQFT